MVVSAHGEPVQPTGNSENESGTRSPAAKLIEQSFIRSFESCDESRALIERAFENDNFQNETEKAVATAQLEFLNDWNSGQRSVESLEISTLQLNASKFPNLNLILKVQRLRWIGSLLDSIFGLDDRQHLDDLHETLHSEVSEAIDKASDPKLVAVAKAFLGYHTMKYMANADQLNMEIEKLTHDKLFKSSVEMQVVLALMRSRARNLSLEEKDQILEDAIKLAREHSRTFYVAQAFDCRILLSPRDVDRNRKLELGRLDAYNQLGSSIEIVKGLRSIARLENRSKNESVALAYLSQAAEHADFGSFPEFDKTKILSDLESTKRALNTKLGLPNPKQPLFDLEKEKSLFVSKRKKDNAFAQSIERANRSNTEKNQLLDLLTFSKATQIRYLWICSALLLSLLAVSVAYRWRVSHYALRAELAEKHALLVEEQNKVLTLETKVARLKKTESLGLMAGNVAHDFNNLLQGVSGNAELLKASLSSLPGPATPHQYHTRVDAISEASNRAQQLAKKILDYAGNQKPQTSVLDLNKFINEEIGLVRSISNQHKFVVEQSDEQLAVQSDKMQLHQVLLNFASNAVEATEAGSTISIRVFKTTIDSGHDFSLFGSRETGGSFCVLEVKDQGIGIPPEHLASVFDPYFSTKHNSSRGLGLAIAYGAAEAHNGWVRCRPNDGPGTTFQLLLPEIQASDLADASADQVSPSPSANGATSICDGRKILIVDDDSSVLETCQMMAENIGLQVTAASGGPEALAILDAQENSIHFDCILTDVVMPKMGAGELIAELEARNIRIPVFVMSGFSHQSLDQFKDLPLVVDILTKPFRLKQLKMTLTQGFNNLEAQASNESAAPAPRPHFDANQSLKKTTDKPSNKA